MSLRAAGPSAGPPVAALAALALAAATAGCGPSPEGDARDRSGDAAAAAAGERTADTARTGPSPGGGTSVPDTTAAPAACEDAVPRAGEEEAMEETPGSGPSVHEVLERRRDAWMERPGVIGTGVGRCDGDPCLVIYLRRLTDELEAELPDCVEGYPVRLEETGTVTPRGGDGAGAR